jgi:hypothetical protein
MREPVSHGEGKSHQCLSPRNVVHKKGRDMNNQIIVTMLNAIADSGKVRLGAYAPALATADAGKVRLGAYAPTLATADAGKVRLGAYAPTLATADAGKVRPGAHALILSAG